MESMSARLMPDRRQDSRHSIDVPGVIMWDGLAEAMTITNISIYGAQLEGHVFPKVGTRSTIIVEGLEICATVIWVGPHKCGVLLEHEIEPADFIRDNAIRILADHVPAPVTVTRISYDRLI
ncbi:hypothetical protein WG907_11370 [Sphingobium sp. AN558]|uniref:hypothetical protein n=1 Tax=Sphingobium sp. AN558 TaxID=3133442 RepID=UPI0030C36DBE